MSLLKAKKTRPFLLLVIGLFVITEIILLSPSPLEEVRVSLAPANPDVFVRPTEASLAPGIPANRIAEYAVDKFNYVSVQSGEKQWKIVADKAYMYNPEKLVHALEVTAHLYDPDDSATIVTGKEAKYILNQKDLEIFGNVHTVFPDGFELRSEYLRYLPNEKRIIIPKEYIVKGEGKQSNDQRMRFVSLGMDYKMAQAEIILPEAVHMTMTRDNPQPTPSASPIALSKESPQKNTSQKTGKDEWTLIESDHCLIYRDRNLAHFSMYPNRPDAQRYVHITQPDLFSRSRRADLRYGADSEALDYMTAFEDVLIKETGNDDELRYGTGGRADFDNIKNLVTLTVFPQVYQDQDTVTGEVIVLHRETDVIEVKHSNAFSQGSSDDTDSGASPDGKKKKKGVVKNQPKNTENFAENETETKKITEPPENHDKPNSP
ncbi:MAG: LPS export ABC transporter periplasmic protein LptC [Bdellovibrio sp.]|nr:LPS export ABC transporter periplasmic protein LptC [Bdellovibrio sp.]